MNNHGIICKNNIMIIFLILFIIFILIVLNKKIKLAIDFSVNGFDYNFCININYFFDLITLYKEDFAKYKAKSSKYKKVASKTNLTSKKWMLQYFNIDRINFDLRFGLDDVFVTSMLVPVVSSVLAILMQKYLGKSTKTFSVKPIYNRLFFSIKGAIYISLKPKDIIFLIFRILKDKKERIKKEEKSNIMDDKDFVKTE